METKQQCLQVPTDAVYVVITWGFNEQHQTWLPAPQHKGRGDKYGNEDAFQRPIKKMQALHSPSLIMFSTNCPEGRKESKFRLKMTRNMTLINKGNSPGTSPELSPWTAEQCYGSVLGKPVHLYSVLAGILFRKMFFFCFFILSHLSTKEY